MHRVVIDNEYTCSYFARKFSSDNRISDNRGSTVHVCETVLLLTMHLHNTMYVQLPPASKHVGVRRDDDNGSKETLIFTCMPKSKSL